MELLIYQRLFIFGPEYFGDFLVRSQKQSLQRKKLRIPGLTWYSLWKVGKGKEILTNFNENVKARRPICPTPQKMVVV